MSVGSEPDRARRAPEARAAPETVHGAAPTPVNGASPAEAAGPSSPRLADGDAAAFRTLYEQYAPLVHAVLIARAPRQEADDLMQDVFLAAWRALPQLRSDEYVGAWLATIARHASARAHRRGGPRHAGLAWPDDESDGAAESRGSNGSRASREPHDPRAAHDDSDELLAVLRSLPEAYRETLALRLVEGLTGPEIASATGLTHGSVRVNLVRGMKLLKDALREKGWP